MDLTIDRKYPPLLFVVVLVAVLARVPRPFKKGNFPSAERERERSPARTIEEKGL